METSVCNFKAYFLKLFIFFTALKFTEVTQYRCFFKQGMRESRTPHRYVLGWRLNHLKKMSVYFFKTIVLLFWSCVGF